MARIRSVHPGLASDEAYMEMSMPAKAAWPLLWTECDDGGVFEWKPIVLKARIFPADNIDFSEILSEYEALGRIRKVEFGGKLLGLVRNFCRYQKPKSPSYRHAISGDLLGYVGRNSEALPQSLPTSSENAPPMEDEKGGGETMQKEKEAAQLRADAHENGHHELLHQLVEAAGLAEPIPQELEDASPIGKLIAKGYSLRDRILPVIRRRRGKAFNSWSYFVPAIVEADQRSAAPAARCAVPVPSVWVPEGSNTWLAVTKARGKPPIVTYYRGAPGAYVKASEIPPNPV